MSTMTPEGDTYTPIPVHVENAHELVSAPAKTRRKAMRTRTIILTADNPVVDLLPQSEERCEAYVLQCGDNDIIVAHSGTQAKATSNTVATPPNPSGALIVKTCLFPIPLPTNDRVWVTSPAFPTRVTVLEFIYASD
jgi:hypothetical protein